MSRSHRLSSSLTVSRGVTLSLRPFRAKLRLRPFKLRLPPFRAKLRLRPFRAKLRLRPFRAKLRVRPFGTKLRVRPFGTKLRVRPFGTTLIIAMLWMASPAVGYIVFLKDGSQIQTKEKYRIEGDKAILILPSGTPASYDASEIDVEKTDAINVVDYGTAKLIEGLNKQTLLAKDTRFETEDNFGEYISGRSLALPEVRKRKATRPADQLPTTRAGFIDLMAFRRSPYPSAEITGEVLGYLKGQGIDRVRIFQGTEADRPLIEIVAASEASVFKAIKDSASGLAQIHGIFPELVTAFVLVLMTESQERAGQFVLTPELADLLVKEQLSVSQFFLRFVEF